MTTAGSCAISRSVRFLASMIEPRYMFSGIGRQTRHVRIEKAREEPAAERRGRQRRRSERLQRGRQRGVGRVPIARVLGEALRDDRCRDGRGRSGRDRGQLAAPARSPPASAASRCSDRRTAPAGQQVVERGADRVDVGPDVERCRRAAVRATRTPACRGSSRRRSSVCSSRASVVIDSPKSPTRTRPSRSTKQFDGLMSRCRMPIAAAASRPAITCRIASTAAAGAQRRAVDDELLQRAARRQLHRDDGKALHLGRAEDVDAVRMAERRGELPFAQEPFALLVVAEPAAQDLHRDAPPALGFLGLVDLAHALLCRAGGRSGTARTAGRARRGTADRSGRPVWPSARTSASRRRTTTSRRSRFRATRCRPACPRS